MRHLRSKSRWASVGLPLAAWPPMRLELGIPAAAAPRCRGRRVCVGRADFGRTPVDGVGWPRAGCGPSQHALDTQDRPLTRPRAPSLACPGLLQWPPIRHIATKMAALSSLPCPPCVHTSKVLCAVCPSEGCRRCLKLQRCVARIFNFTVLGPKKSENYLGGDMVTR